MYILNVSKGILDIFQIAVNLRGTDKMAYTKNRALIPKSNDWRISLKKMNVGSTSLSVRLLPPE
jgi:hypothetical protein